MRCDTEKPSAYFASAPNLSQLLRELKVETDVKFPDIMSKTHNGYCRTCSVTLKVSKN